MKENKKMKIFITGGYGFIGTHLVKNFSKKHNVVIYGLQNNRDTFKYFKDKIDKKNVKCIFGDILDIEKLNFFISKENVDVVIHCAAIAGVSNYYKYPDDTIKINGIGTYNIIETAHKNNVKKTIILSSSETYGNSQDVDELNGKTVLDSVYNLRNTYSIGKLFGDQVAIAYNKRYKMNICSIRPFGIWGPGQIGEGFLQIAIRKAILNENIDIVEDGTQTRDWCYINDFIDAINICVNKNKQIEGKIINIGDPRTHNKIINTTKIIINTLKSKSKINFVKRENVKDIKFRKTNIEVAKKILNWKPKANFKSSIIKTAKWYKENNFGENITYF